MGDIRGLTILQPWAHLIAHGPKRVENRTWAPPRSLVGGYLAIHAGKTPHRPTRVDQWGAAIEHAEHHGMLANLPVLAQLAEIPAGDRGDRFRFARQDHYMNTAVPYGAIVAVARLVRDLTEFDDCPEQAAWWVGPHGWLLDNVVALPTPVECSGAQGLWELRPDVLDQVRAQWREVRRAG